MNAESVKRLIEIDLPALSGILPDLMLAKMGDRAADLDTAMQVVSYAVANLRDVQREIFGLTSSNI